MWHIVNDFSRIPTKRTFSQCEIVRIFPTIALTVNRFVFIVHVFVEFAVLTITASKTVTNCHQ